jgi:hypothetical protein
MEHWGVVHIADAFDFLGQEVRQYGGPTIAGQGASLYSNG